MPLSVHAVQIRGVSAEIPDAQFYDDSLAPPAHVTVRRKSELMPHPVDLLVLNVMYQNPGALHCFEIAERIYKITNARISVSHKQVWLSLRRLITAKWVECSSRERDAGRRDSALYRLRYGGGSHLRSENKRWRKLAPLITAVAELK
jgi:DNA-binding PadR family transcriptional regulator